MIQWLRSRHARATSSTLVPWFALATLLLLPACRSLEISKGQYEHIICADSDGDSCDLSIDGKVVHSNHKSHAEEIARAFVASGKQRIMLVIHGGLVDMEVAVKDAREALARIEKDPQMQEVFPIFINWETGIRRSYFDHLFFVRAGLRNALLATLTSPFVLIGDFGRAIASTPMTVTQQLRNLYFYYASELPVAIPEGWRDSAGLDRTEEDDDWLSVTGDAALEVVPGAFRLATGVLLDAVGIPAYKNMRRRARVLFIRDEDYGRARHELSGALPMLMEAIAAQRSGARITVVAHSMGCSVANELVLRYGSRRFQDQEHKEQAALVFDEIVYMGAACTMREFAGSVLPYVREHPDVHFYNLCLHPFDEVDDRYMFGAVPHGSLLEWIDDYITEQESPLDRTLGKWNNAMIGLPLIDYLVESVRKRVITKGFPRRGSGPHDHGDFNDIDQRYWRREFWALPPKGAAVPTTQKR